MGAHFVEKKSNRERRCRICDGTIPRGDIALVLYNLHVSPKIVKLFFHKECLLKSIYNATIINDNS